MSTESDNLFEVAKRLPESDQLTLVARLLESMPDVEGLPSVDDPEFVDALEERFADAEGTVDWKDLLEE